jgi:hypothetical protein
MLKGLRAMAPSEGIMSRTGLVLCVWVAVCATGLAASAGSYSDNFNDGTIDSTYWNASTFDGSTLTPAKGRIAMVQGHGPVSGGGANLTFKYPLVGDFVADIDFTLINWPADNIGRCGFRCGALPNIGGLLNVARVSDATYGPYAYPEFYGSKFSDSETAVIGTSDQSGRLRTSRTGTTVAGFYWKDDAWALIGSHTASGNTASIDLSISLWDFVTDTAGVKIAFDNFVLDAPGTSIPAVPEPTALVWLLSVFPASAIRRRRTRC